MKHLSGYNEVLLSKKFLDNTWLNKLKNRIDGLDLVKNSELTLGTKLNYVSLLPAPKRPKSNIKESDEAILSIKLKTGEYIYISFGIVKNGFWKKLDLPAMAQKH